MQSIHYVISHGFEKHYMKIKYENATKKVNNLFMCSSKNGKIYDERNFG